MTKHTLLVSTYIMLAVWIAYAFFRTDKTDEVVFSMGGGTKEISFVKSLIEEFEARNPAIKVKLNVLPAPTDQQHHYYLTTLGAKTREIDVMRIDTIWIAEFASAGWLESLEGYINPEDRASFIPVMEKTDVFRGHLYAIPWDANIGLLYYRKDLLEKYNLDAPHTWDDLVKACLKISSGEHVYGYLFQQGKGLCLRNWTYVWELCQEDPLMKGKVGVSLLPKFSDGNPASVYGGWHLAINAHSKKKEQAWKLIEFLTSPEAQRELAMNLSWAPTRHALYNDPELIQKLPFLPIVELALKDVQIRPNLPYYQWVSDILQKHINRVLSNQTGSQEALQTIQTKLEGIKNEFAKD